MIIEFLKKAFIAESLCKDRQLNEDLSKSLDEHFRRHCIPQVLPRYPGLDENHVNTIVFNRFTSPDNYYDGAKLLSVTPEGSFIDTSTFKTMEKGSSVRNCVFLLNNQSYKPDWTEFYSDRHRILLNCPYTFAIIKSRQLSEKKYYMRAKNIMAQDPVTCYELVSSKLRTSWDKSRRCGYFNNQIDTYFITNDESDTEKPGETWINYVAQDATIPEEYLHHIDSLIQLINQDAVEKAEALYVNMMLGIEKYNNDIKKQKEEAERKAREEEAAIKAQQEFKAIGKKRNDMLLKGLNKMKK